jgi:CRISPR-associated endonuclease/helicase Cas3
VQNSVVILDEVQTLPLDLLPAINSMLDRLVRDFGVTVVHCSATQPLLLQPSTPAKEIAPDPPALFAAAGSRVRIDFPADLHQPSSYAEIASRIQSRPERQVLTIVHRRADAIELAQLLGESCLHLSTWMCPAHRLSVIAEIKRRLREEENCCVVSTQLVEAGVDIDFPLVFRAFAGLDSLIQSAGRCNREGKAAEPADFITFLAPTSPPRGILEKGFGIARQMLLEGHLRPDNWDLPATVANYFAELRKLEEGLRGKEFITSERACDFPQSAQFAMIEEFDQVTVIAPYGDWNARVESARTARGLQSIRALQPLTVSLYRQTFNNLRRFLEPLWPESDVWVPLPSCAPSIYNGRFGFGAAEKLEDSYV